ncbi:hypothetical protein T03_15915 [Trichinella britovi]|uniref:Uncharacterized protein n=1 Tax=Trichinella britovi TaxID=45882 RepID=A0A0V1D1Z8_TRIBR|nr:hypothetical protein T03_15915 [Trichinella britovi]
MDGCKRKRDSSRWVGSLLALVVCVGWTGIHSRRSASLFPLGHRLFIKGFCLSSALCIEFLAALSNCPVSTSSHGSLN